MPHGADAGNARKAARLAACTVLLGAVMAAVAIPAGTRHRSPTSTRGRSGSRRWTEREKARLASPVVNSYRRHGGMARRRAVGRRADRGRAQQAGPYVELQLVQDLGTRRELHRRGTAQRPGRLDLVRLSARLRHHRRRIAPRLRVLELERLLPDLVRSWDVRPAGTNSALNPIVTSGQTSPSLLGARIISLEDSSSPTVINVQNAGAGNPYTNAFTPWLNTAGVGLDLEGVDVAANGRLAALGFETWNGGTQTVGKIAVIATQGVDQAPTFQPPWTVPARGRHRAGRIARAGRRRDRVEGRRRREGRRQPLHGGRSLRDVEHADVLSATGAYPSIGGADVAAFLPKPQAPRRRRPRQGPGRRTCPSARS